MNAFIIIYYSESVNRNIPLYNVKKNQKVLSKLMFDTELFVGIPHFDISQKFIINNRPSILKMLQTIETIK